MAEPVALKYHAFISYSHYSHADTSWAKWLHRGLESFGIDKNLVLKPARGAIPSHKRCENGPNPDRRWMDRHWLGDGR